jgi:hypothetical protein
MGQEFKWNCEGMKHQVSPMDKRIQEAYQLMNMNPNCSHRSRPVISALILSMGLALCASSCLHFEDSFVKRLRKTITIAATQEPSVFSMTNVTDFVWDKLLVIEPYTPVSAIEKVVGQTWPQADQLGFVPEETCLLVFMNKENIAKVVVFSFLWGNLTDLRGTNGFSPRNSTFLVHPQRKVLKLPTETQNPNLDRQQQE